MRNKILAIAAIAGAMSAPVAAQAQGVVTTGVAPGGAVVVEDVDGIAVDQRPAFREYIIRERVPSYTIPDRVIVGGVLPETGVTYYDVPQTYGVTPYRYTVVNGQTVLVDPGSETVVVRIGQFQASPDHAYSLHDAARFVTEALVRDTGRGLCEANVLYSGRRQATAEANLTAADSGKLLAHGIATCMILGG